MRPLQIDPVNGACGALFIALGLIFAYESWMLDMGTALRMGPGYFPSMLALVLLLLGVVVFIQAVRIKSEPFGPIARRGMLLILPAPVVFGLTVQGLGFVPAIFLSALISSFASLRMKPLAALVLSICVTVFAYFVFTRGLGLPFRSFGPWLSL